MAIEILPQRQSFFAEVSGVDLRQPLAAKQWQEIQTAFHEYAILLFRAQPLTDEEHIAFSARFGPVFTATNYHWKTEARRVHTKMADISNIGNDGQFYRPTTSADSTAARMNSGTRTIPSNLCRRDVHCFSHEKCPSKAAIQNSPICVPLTTHSQKKRKSRLKTSSLNIASSIRAPCWDLMAIQTVPSRSYRPSRKS